MERLTKLNGNGEYYFPACWRKCKGNPQDCDHCPEDDKICQKLGEYEDAEESGLMVRLPCKVGDLLYEAGESEIYTYIVDEIHVEQDSKVIVYALEYDADLHRVYQNGYKYDNCDFGKTVFLTREEAEQALEEKGEL